MYIHPLLASVPARAREALVRLIELRRYRRNEVVLQAGAAVESLYCVGSGLLRVVVPGPNDAAVTTSFLSPDDLHLGAPLTGPRPPSDLSLVAALPSSVYLMPLWTLQRLCAHYPEVPQVLLQTQLRQMGALRKQIRRRTTLSAERLVGRVLQELTELAPEGEQAFDRRISQGVIASYAGLSRPMVNKVLRDLEERGLVQRDGDAVHVQDDPAFDSDFHAPLVLDDDCDGGVDADVHADGDADADEPDHMPPLPYEVMNPKSRG